MEEKIHLRVLNESSSSAKEKHITLCGYMRRKTTWNIEEVTCLKCKRKWIEANCELFSRKTKNNIVMAIKNCDELTGSDTLNLMYEYAISQNEHKTLTAVAVAALNEREIKTDEDIEAIKKDRRIGELQVFLNDVVREWIEKKMKEGVNNGK